MIFERIAGQSNAFSKRLRQGQTRGLDDDVIGADGQSHQSLDRRDEIIGDGAADTAIGKLNDVLHRAIRIGAGFQNVAIDADGAKFIDQDRQTLALRVLHQMADQRGFASPQKAGDHGDGDF